MWGSSRTRPRMRTGSRRDSARRRSSSEPARPRCRGQSLYAPAGIAQRMGINLSNIVTLEPRKLEDFSGKVLAIDAFNTLYQFLAIIRQPNGTPLMDRQGRVTSHLSGVIYRLSNFVEAGIKPVFVFDGEPPRLKARTIQLRGEIKRRAEREWRAGVEGGGPATPRTEAEAAAPLTGGRVEHDTQRLVLLRG